MTEVHRVDDVLDFGVTIKVTLLYSSPVCNMLGDMSSAGELVMASSVLAMRAIMVNDFPRPIS